MTARVPSNGTRQARTPGLWVGLLKVGLPMFAAIAGALVALVSLRIHWFLSDHNWRGMRYSWERRGVGQEIVDELARCWWERSSSEGSATSW